MNNIEMFEEKHQVTLVEVKQPKKENGLYHTKVKVYRPDDGTFYMEVKGGSELLVLFDEYKQSKHQ